MILEPNRAQQFLTDLRDRMRHEADSEFMLAETAERLGRFLGVERVGYGEFDLVTDDNFHVRSDWITGSAASIVGPIQFSAFGPEITASHRKGEIWVQSDLSDPRLDAPTRELLAGLGIVGCITVPLLKEGRIVALMSAQQSEPRTWSPSEVELIVEVAERTWATLERARAEAALRESEALLSAIMAHAPIGIYLKDEQGRYVIANAEMTRLLKRRDGELVGKAASDLFDDAVATEIERLDRTVLETGTLQVLEQHFPDASEYEHTLSMRFPVQTQAGDAPQVAGFTIDITALKRAEAALEQSREALFQSEKLTALGSLLAGVSHELNNPLSIIVAQAELLEHQAAGTPLAERAGKIRNAATRSARIVQTFLAMARQRKPQRVAASLNDLVHAALEMTDYGLRSNSIEVRTTLSRTLTLTVGDSDQLHQLIVNLILNSQQAMQEHDGPRVLMLKTAMSSDGEQVQLEVADTGPGVPRALRRRIFEPFFTTKEQGVGTGVGLSFSQGIAEAHGGSLELVETRSGAKFRLRLPLGPSTANGESERSSDDRGSRSKATALIVDDETEIAESLAGLLALEGYESTLAAGGMEAKALLTDQSFDLVISDVRMPGLAGPALFDWVRGQRPELTCRLAFLTGDTLASGAASFLESAQHPVLEKPFTRTAVQKLVEDIRTRKGAGA